MSDHKIKAQKKYKTYKTDLKQLRLSNEVSSENCERTETDLRETYERKIKI